MNLGIDISTRKVGLAVVNQEQNNALYSIEHTETLFLDKKSLEICSLEEKAWIFRDKIKELKFNFNISNIFVEAPLNHGGPNANTVATLLRFNGMCTFILYDLFNKMPSMINVRSARSVLGIKTPRAADKKITEHEKKRPVIDYVSSFFKNTKTPFLYEITPKGNPKPGVDDIADALVLAIAGPILTVK